MNQTQVVIVAAALAFALSSCSKSHVVEAGFWFDHVDFDLPQGDVHRLGGPIEDDEKARIESVARTELEDAYRGLRIKFSSAATGFYRVSVVQDIPARGLPTAGQSRRLPSGGVGAVNFRTVADSAVAYAPPGASRAQMIEGIGRGIGRTAAHEFAHQILPRVNLHATKDKDSYEFASSERASQFYGPLHWAFARPHLVETLGVEQ